MLSRTADSLFWLGRYTERAGNVARGLQVATRMASLSLPLGGPGDEWRSLLISTGCEDAFDEVHPGPLDPAALQDAALHYLTWDTANPASIVSCIEAARRNGRAVRTALTVDMWEALNDTWIELRRLAAEVGTGDRLPGTLDWVRHRTLLFNGAASDTMLRDDAWRFLHLGTMLERADHTARLLDVKHNLLTPLPAGADGAVDYVQWQAILRSVSALRSFQWVYRSRLEPKLIAELLILRPELPRSLVACYRRADRVLEEIAVSNGNRRGEPHRLIGELHAHLRYGRIQAILDRGLPEFLTETIDRNVELGRQIGAYYLNA